MVVLSTHTERVHHRVPEVEEEEEEGEAGSGRLRHNGAKTGQSHNKRA